MNPTIKSSYRTRKFAGVTIAIGASAFALIAAGCSPSGSATSTVSANGTASSASSGVAAAHILNGRPGPAEIQARLAQVQADPHLSPAQKELLKGEMTSAIGRETPKGAAASH